MVRRVTGRDDYKFGDLSAASMEQISTTIDSIEKGSVNAMDTVGALLTIFSHAHMTIFTRTHTHTHTHTHTLHFARPCACVSSVYWHSNLVTSSDWLRMLAHVYTLTHILRRSHTDRLKDLEP
jgi:hypothetical protein